MANFQEVLQAELAKPIPLKNKEGQFIDATEQMVKAVMKNAMEGDLQSIAFINAMTRDIDPEKEKEMRAGYEAKLKTVINQLTEQLKKESAYDGQDLEIKMVAEIQLMVEKLTDIINAPDFQAMTTDPRTGKQSVSPVIQMRDKQRETFQTQLDKLRQNAMQRAIMKKQLRK